MDDFTLTIELKCLFCDSVLQGDTEKELESGDMIKCLECEELNDYDSVLDIAKEEGLEKVKEQALGEVTSRLKGIFK